MCAVFTCFFHTHSRNGETTLHIVGECWNGNQPVAVGLQPQSPLEEAFSTRIGIMRELGMLDRWIGQELDKVGR